MLHIERLRLRLPAGFEHRAAFIARLVGDALADFQPREDRQLDSLTIGPVRVEANATDQEIAQGISRRIASVLGKRK